MTAIDRSFKSSDRTYGARRVWHDLLAEDLSCGWHRVERLMHENGLGASRRRRGLPKDTGERAAVSDNILDRLIGRGLFAASSEGVPQGGVLSPLLSNIMLHEFEAWLEAKY